VKRDGLAAHFASEVFLYDVNELPKPNDKFERWSTAVKKAMESIVMLVTRDDAGTLENWRYDPYAQKFEFTYNRVIRIKLEEGEHPVTVTSRFFVDPKNQKPGQREGPLWDEVWCCGEEVRQFNEGLTKQLKIR